MAFTEKIGTLTATSTTQVQLTGDSIIKLGGQQRVLQSPTLLTSVSGIGGLDTGAIAASSFYYVYAVYNGSTTGIVASLNSTSPTGFTRFKKVGAFYTDTSSNIFRAYKFGENNIITMTSELGGGGAPNSQSPFNWITTISGGPNPYTATLVAGIFSLAPIIVVSTGSGSVYRTAHPITLTSSSFTYSTLRTDTTPPSAYLSSNVNAVAQRRGVDAIQPDWN